MKIKNIDIHNFAGLKNYTLHFDSGRNLYYGPNERGKSTVIQFIFAMFYGLGDRRGDDNMRDRLSSRDGSAMSGTIWFEHEGKTFELNRQFGNTKAQDIVELLDLEINKRVDLDNPEQVGAEVFGLEREIFQNTVFIESEKLEISAESSVNNAIWDNITNFMVSADSNVTVDLVESRLEKESLTLLSKSKRAGIIPKLDENLRDLEQEKYWRELALSEQETQLAELEELEESLQAQKLELENLEIEERILDLAEDKNNLEMIDQPQIAFAKAKEEEQNLREELEFLNEESDINLIYEDVSNIQKDIERHEEDSKDFIERREALEEDKQKFAKESTKKQSLNVALFFVVLIILFFTFSLLEFPIAIVVAVAVIAIFGLWLFSNHRANKNFADKSADASKELIKDVKEHEQKGEQISSILSELSIEKELSEENYSSIYAELDGISDLLQELRFKQRDIERIEDQIKHGSYTQEDRDELARHIEAETSALTKMGYELEGLKYSPSEKQKIENKLRELRASMSQENERFNAIEIDVKSRFRDPISGQIQSPSEEKEKTETKLAQVREELAEAKLDHEAYEIARTVFSDSLVEFRKTLLPKLSQTAAKYINTISRGRYSEVIIGDDLSLMIRDNFTGNRLEPDKFSSGTRDQIWLSYRLALADYLAEGTSFPLLLDDIFVNYDDKRTKASLDLLDFWSSENDRQVILFTHHKHIKDFAGSSETWKVRTIPRSNT